MANITKKGLLLSSLIAVAVALTACGGVEPAKKAEPRMSEMPPPPAPADNPITADKVALGKQLFHDKRLSGNGQMACLNCHYHHLGWTDALSLSKQASGNTNSRHTPTLYNTAYLGIWYWDGRSATMEAQTMAAWRNQMGADPAKVAEVLNAVAGYKDQFHKVYGGPATGENIVKSLTTYVRTLNTGESAWDRYEKGDQNAVSADAKQGFELFVGKGRCVVCHTPPLYSNAMFYNIGLEAGKEKRDVGRFNVTKAPEDTSAFKTPTLRAVAKSGPYFHDGSAATLEQAVRYMANTHKADQHKSPLLIDAGLTDPEIKKVVAFLTTLNGNDTYEAPKLP
jgi:cytochrome c peroxidase